MEAAPRLPMISFELKTSPEPANFGPTLKQYIASFYHEDPESYSAEIQQLEGLRAAAARPSTDVAGCQTLKRYYSQLSFLKSRFPMGKGQASAVQFTWKEAYTGSAISCADIDFEMGCVLYNVGALHSQLGAADSRATPDGMKMACTHFQCAAWAFQQVREQAGSAAAAPADLLHFMAQLCLAQAQECILEKSMMDGRKATIIARVAAQLVDYYGQALTTLAAGDESAVAEAAGTRAAREWARHLAFKVQYHGCVALLYQGQQAEEQQKMGERVAYYQAASEALERARRAAADMSRSHDVVEALAFTQDVVEGKRKAARNENEFIYHERVPEREALARVQGASLVKGIAFSVTDPDVSGPDIFKRLVPMEAHEASSVYSEQKAEMLRQVVALVEAKDAELAEFMSSLRLEVVSRWRQATSVPADVVDRAAALCARPHAVQTLVDAMGRLGTASRDVDTLLTDIRALVAHDERSERDFQSALGAGRPPGLVATELAREAAKYSEAHSKAADSNEALHRAMAVHVANLRALQRPLVELRSSVPCSNANDPNLDESAITEVETLAAKVDEMRAQRAALVAGLREAVRADDITGLLVTRPANLQLEQLFQQQLAKHGRQAALIEQNLAAQQNILSAMTEAYARFGPSRRHMTELLRKREATSTALVASYDAYDDLLAKVNKGIEFYQKLESNVSKLLQRVKSACRVNDEERDQVLASSSNNSNSNTGGGGGVSSSGAPVSNVAVATTSTSSTAPKLKDYLASMKQAEAGAAVWAVPAVRPAPLGSETTGDTPHDATATAAAAAAAVSGDYYGYGNAQYSTGYYTAQQAPAATPPPTYAYPYQQPTYSATDAYAAYTTTVAYTTTYTTPTTISSTYNTTDGSGQVYPTSYPQQQPQVQPVANAYVPNTASTHPPNTASTYPTNTASTYPSNTANTYVPNTASTYPANTASTYVPNTANTYPANTASTYVPNTANTYPANTASTYVPNTASTYPSNTASTYPSNTASTYPPNTARTYPTDTASTYSSYTPAAGGYTAPTTMYSSSTGYGTATPTPPPPATVATTYTTTNPDYTATTNNVSGYVPNYSTLNTGYTTSPGYLAPTTMEYASAYITPSGTYPSAEPPYYYPSEQYNDQYYPAGYQQQPQQAAASQAQYTSAGAHPTSQTDSQKAAPIGVDGALSAAQYYTAPYGYQTPGSNPLTMVHANNNSTSAMTNSQPPATNVPPKQSTSNVDLLAGLDISVTQAPLVPQLSVPTPPPTTTTTTALPPPVNTNNTPTPHTTNTTTQESPKRVVKAVNISEEEEEKDGVEEPAALEAFSQEVERLQKLVAGLTTRSLNGPTALDTKWKEVQEWQERGATGRSISVARCYPMKNRCADILPYDQTRVELPSTKDDYINASHVRLSGRCPPLIVTQAPLAGTLHDFWTMVCEHQVEVCVCLVADVVEPYWPAERGASLAVGTRYKITVRGLNEHSYWTERVLAVADAERPGAPAHLVVHLHFHGWPGVGLMPADPKPMLALVRATLACHREQRARQRPVLVHCLAGVGPSGVFCVLLAAAAQPTAPASLDVARLAALIGAQRKNVLRDREHLRFVYGAVLQLAQETLAARRGSDVSARLHQLSLDATSPTPTSPSGVRDPADPLSALDPLWTMKK